MFNRSLILLPLLAARRCLAGCKPENKFQPPPPPEISVGTPLQQQVTPYEELTGNTVAFATVDLVARVEGFLASINYADGAYVEKGDLLFQIEQTMYKAQVKEADAELASAKAAARPGRGRVHPPGDPAAPERHRRRTPTTPPRPSAIRRRANVENQEGNLTIAQTNLGYTTVTAPFDGVVTKHLISVGELVGASTKTKLATIVQLDPIYVTFNMSEQDVLKIRENLDNRRLSLEELSKIPLDIGLMNEQGFPHQGNLNYVSPEVDPTTGTILVRGLFNNPNRDLLPGFFVRISVPTGSSAKASLLVPEPGDRRGPGRQVRPGRQQGRRGRAAPRHDRPAPGRRPARDRPRASAADDRVVLSTNGQAIPGNKVVPKVTTIAAPPTGASAPPK